MYMLGFNFETDMDTVITELANFNYTLEDLGLSSPPIDSRTYFVGVNDLMNAFNNNYDVYKLVCNGIKNAQTKKEYDAFCIIYRAYFTMRCNRDFYKGSDSLTEFLKNRNTTLYKSLCELKLITDQDVLKETIANIIQYIVYTLEDLLKGFKENFETSMFKYIPTASIDAIRKYIMQVINFYKSFRIQIYNMNTIYKFNDKLDNTVRILERVYLDSAYNKKEYVRVIDNGILDILLNPKENIGLIDNMHIYINHIFRKYLNSVIKPREKVSFDINTNYIDNVNIRERVSILTD